MRDWLNAILAFIVTSSLTDVEYNAIDQTGMIVQVYNQESYDQLSLVLTSRGDAGTLQDRLTAFYTAKGVDIEASDTAKSNIYLGDVL